MFPGKSSADCPEPPSKRQRTANLVHTGALISLDREISPPPLKRGSSSAVAHSALTNITREFVSTEPHFAIKESIGSGGKRKPLPIGPPDFIDLTGGHFKTPTSRTNPGSKQRQPGLGFSSSGKRSAEVLPSPFQLTSIRDLPASENVDTVGIKDILGDVMIREAWVFNFLVDLDWVMSQFDPDIQQSVDVKIVHGSWRKEDNNRIRIEEQSKRYPNTKIICAYMPEPFGTHHSKIIVLFRHDDFAQVIIHTSNMIAFDWANMTQAVWRSPLLPLIPIQNKLSGSATKTINRGIGNTFKDDLLAYFVNYGKSRTGGLTQELKKYSFDEVKAVFIGSVPGRFQVDRRGKGEMWGWMALKRVMNNIQLSSNSLDQEGSNPGRIVVQISSIATLGQTNTWLSPVLYEALSVSRSDPGSPLIARPLKPKLSIIFPTAEEVRNSLNGYSSGTAIHTKIQSKTQQRQLNYLRPFLCHWSSSLSPAASNQLSQSVVPERLSGRSRAAPHIKTYIRFADEACTKIDWAMLTSANLSTQAWGSNFGNPSGRPMEVRKGEVRICSYEAGVLVYPELFKDSKEEDVKMVPVFKTDTPDAQGVECGKLVGLRMAYDLPIKAYEEKDMPWCATMSYGVSDWLGQTWEGS